MIASRSARAVRSANTSRPSAGDRGCRQGGGTPVQSARPLAPGPRFPARPPHEPGGRRQRRVHLARQTARGSRTSRLRCRRSGRAAHGHTATVLAAAALTVFLRSTAMVRGPTPPGTGVSAPAISATFACLRRRLISRRSKSASRFEPASKSAVRSQDPSLD